MSPPTKRSKKAAPASAEAAILTRYTLPPGFVYVPPTRVVLPSGHVHWTGGSCGLDEGVDMWVDEGADA